MHSLARLLLAALLVAGCGPGDSTAHFQAAIPDGDMASFAEGTAVWSGTSSLELISEGPATLTGAEALGLPAGIPVTWTVNRLDLSGAGMAIFPEDTVPEEVRAVVVPLAGVSIAQGDGPFQVIAQFAVPAADVEIRGYRLRYETGGGKHTVFIPHSDHICHAGVTECAYISPTP